MALAPVLHHQAPVQPWFPEHTSRYPVVVLHHAHWLAWAGCIACDNVLLTYNTYNYGFRMDSWMLMLLSACYIAIVHVILISDNLIARQGYFYMLYKFA